MTAPESRTMSSLHVVILHSSRKIDEALKQEEPGDEKILENK
jgi:hypothetical protein